MKNLVKKTKGTVSQFSDDSLEFTPQGKGEPVYEHSYKVGEATIGKTKGTGRQNFVAKLKCSTDEADPCEAMHQQLDKLGARAARGNATRAAHALHRAGRDRPVGRHRSQDTLRPRAGGRLRDEQMDAMRHQLQPYAD